MKISVEEQTSSLLQALIEPFTDHPFIVSVEKLGNSVEFTVELSPVDLKKLGGAKGKTCNSLTTIVRAAGIKAGVNFDLSFRTTLTAHPKRAKSVN